MAKDLTSFIKEQMSQGRDARTIREYLIGRNVDKKSIDKAFDKSFGGSSHPAKKSSAEKFVIAGMIVLFLILVMVGFNIYYKIDPLKMTPKEPIRTFEPSTTNDLKTPSVVNCEFEDSEQKYDCYVSKFENNEVKCYEIKDYNEKDFCYRVQDFYALSNV